MHSAKTIGGGLFLAAALAFASEARAAETTHYNLHDSSFNAGFLATTDCSFTTTVIRYSEVSTQTTGAPVVSAITLVDVQYQDFCTGEAFVLTGGTTTQTATVQGNLGSATLVATVPLTDESGTISTTLSINISATANGDTQTVHDVFNSHAGGTVFHQHLRFSARSASVSGSITGTLPLSSGSTTIQFAPGSSSDFGQIANNTVGAVTVTKKQ